MTGLSRAAGQWWILGALGATVASGCGDDGGGGDRFAESCAGRFVRDCGVAHGISEVVAASITPAGLGVDDFDTPGTVEVTLRTCAREDVPRPHQVIVSAVITPDGLPVDPLDAGTPEVRIEELGRVADDGRDGDAMERDGLVTATLTPPVFDSDQAVPANRAIQVRFQSFIPNLDPDVDPIFRNDCKSEPFDVAYTTGPRVDRP